MAYWLTWADADFFWRPCSHAVVEPVCSVLRSAHVVFVVQIPVFLEWRMWTSASSQAALAGNAAMAALDFRKYEFAMGSAGPPGRPLQFNSTIQFIHLCDNLLVYYWLMEQQFAAESAQQLSSHTQCLSVSQSVCSVCDCVCQQSAGRYRDNLMFLKCTHVENMSWAQKMWLNGLVSA